MKGIKGISNIIILALALIATICIVVFSYFSENSTMYNISIIGTYLLLGLVCILIVAFAIIALVSNFKKAKGSLIGIGLLAAILLISFIIAKADVGPFYDKFEIGPTTSKVIGGGIIATYLAMLGVIVAVLYFEVSKLFK